MPEVSKPQDQVVSAELLFLTKVVEVVRETIETSMARFTDTASHSSGTELTRSEILKAKDLRMAILLGKIPGDTGILIDKKKVAFLLQISERHVNRLVELRAIPAPVRLGAAIRWRLVDILEWIDAGCPTQRNWSSPSKRGK